MHHFFEAITNTAGQSLIGYFARVINPATQMQVTLASDDAGTPIQVVSGVANMAKTDEFGNLSLYVTPGTYNLDIYGPDATSFLFRVLNIAMNSSKGDPGDIGPPGPQGDGLAQVTAPGGANLVGFDGRSAGAKLQEIVSITDARFAGGAKGDGVTNCNAAMDAVLAAINPVGGVILVPTGDYVVTKAFNIADGVSFRGDGSIASRFLNKGTTNCLVYGTGVAGSDPDIERTGVEGIAIIGSPTSGKAFWGRKATTMFYLRDVYIESGNSPVVLDSCYSLMMERVQVRAAETGDNIKLNSISHDVTLLHCASQVAKAGAGYAIDGCYIPRIIGGKAEFNARDQVRIGTGNRGVSIRDMYIEGIQPTSTGYAGINVVDSDTVLISGGFFDATQSGPVGTNGTGTYVKVSGNSSRVRLHGYGFVSVDPNQIHVNFAASADNCEAEIPSAAAFVNANPRANSVHANRADSAPVRAYSSASYQITHDATTTLSWGTEDHDAMGQWNVNTFTPKYSASYDIRGFVQVAAVAGGSQANLILKDTSTGGDVVAQEVRYFAAGSPSLEFDFCEFLTAGRSYQIQVYYFDGAAISRSTTASAASNRIVIERAS